MSTVQHFGAGDQSSLGASLTRYTSLFQGTAFTTVESAARCKMASAGTLSLLGMYVSANDHGTATIVRPLKSGSTINSLLTASSTGQVEDSSNTDAFIDDDLINLRCVTGSGGTTFVMETQWHTFAPSSGTVSFLSAQASSNQTGGDKFVAMSQFTSVGTEAQAQHTIGVNATLFGGFINCSSNTRDQATEWRIRTNGIDGLANMVIQFAGSSGAATAEDVTNTESISDAEEVCWTWKVLTSTTGTFGLNTAKVEVTATNAWPMFCGGPGTAQTSALTHYHPVGGRLHHGETTRQDSEVQTNQAFTWSDLYGYISLYTLNAGGLTIRSVINGSNGNQTFNLTSSTQGSDTSNTDTVASGDEIVFSSVTGGSSGSATLRVLSSLATAVQSAPSQIPPRYIFVPRARDTGSRRNS